jgi:hypothetical protein
MFSCAGQEAVMSSDISCYQTRGSWEYGDYDDCRLLEVTTHRPKVCEVKGIVIVNIGPQDKYMCTFLL